MNDHILKEILEELAANTDKLAAQHEKMQKGVLNLIERFENHERRLAKLEKKQLE